MITEKLIILHEISENELEITTQSREDGCMIPLAVVELGCDDSLETEQKEFAEKIVNLWNRSFCSIGQ